MKLKNILKLVAITALIFGFETNVSFAKEASPKNILILVAHPNLESSIANKALYSAVKDMNNVTAINIYSAPLTNEHYANKIKNADAIVFQFPFYWASDPSELKKWTDEIFMENQKIVKGKKLQVVVTTGAPEKSYSKKGSNKYNMNELLRPYEFIANYTGMKWQKPIVIYGMQTPEITKLENPAGATNIQTGIKEYKKRLSSL